MQLKAIFKILLSILPFFATAQELDWAVMVETEEASLGYCIAIDNNNNVFLAGGLYSMADFDNSDDSLLVTSNGSFDCFIAKYDENGNVLWAFNIGGANSDEIYSIVTDGENIFVGGRISYDTIDFDPSADTFNLVSEQSWDGFIAKYDNDGNFIWAKKIGCNSTCEVKSIALNNNNSLVATGFFFYQLFVDDPSFTDTMEVYGNKDIFLLSFNLDGSYQWGFNIGDISDTMFPGSCEGWAVACDGDNNIYLAGSIMSHVDFDPKDSVYLVLADNINKDGFLAKYTPQGEIVWAFSFGAGGNDYCKDIHIDSDSNVYITGGFKDNVDFDPSTNSYILDGHPFFGNTFVSKYTSYGEIIWAFNVSSHNNPNASYCLSSDSNNNIFVGGFLCDSSDFDPSENEYLLISDSWSGYIASYSNSKQLNWAYNVGEHTDEVFCVIAKEDYLYLSGYFGYECNFDFLGGEYLFYSGIYGSTAFLAKYANITSVKENDLFVDVRIYPNPTNKYVYVSCENIEKIELWSVSGNLLKSYQVEQKGLYKTIDVANLKSGLYFIKIIDNKENYICKKIIKN